MGSRRQKLVHMAVQCCLLAIFATLLTAGRQGDKYTEDDIGWGFYPPMHEMNLADPGSLTDCIIDPETRLFDRLEAASDMRIDYAIHLQSDCMLAIEEYCSLPVDERQQPSNGNIYALDNKSALNMQKNVATGILDSREIYLCIGRQWPSSTASPMEIHDFDSSCCFPCVATCEMNGDALQLVSRKELTARFWLAACIADFDQDGMLDIVFPVSHGVSGGGGFDVFSLEASGELTHGGYHGSGYSAFSLVDLDGDGYWEIESRDRLMYMGARGSFEFNAVWSCRDGLGNLRPDTDHFEEYLKPQRSFYQKMLPDLKDWLYMGQALIMDDKPYMEHQGRLYRLYEVGFEPHDLESLLGSWDSISFDRDP